MAAQEFYIKTGEKKGVVVGGAILGQRFPVTLYAPAWIELLKHSEEILKYIEDNKDSLVWSKEGK